MKRNHTVALTLLTLLVFTAAALLLGGVRHQSFSGRRVKKTDAYLLEARKMNGTDLHTLELEKGDTLYIRLETEKGSLDMEVKAPDGTPLYRGNGRESTDLALNIPQSGLYKIAVEGRHAKGSVRVGHSQA